jgi:bacterioferritin (cytochrome b1)
VGRELEWAANQEVCLNPEALLMLAELPSPQSPQAIGWVMIIVSSLMLSVNQGLGILQYFRDPLKTQRTEDLQRISGESKARKEDSDRRIDAIEERVTGFATTAQLRELKEDVHNRLKEMSAYLHETHHGITGELKALYTAGEQRAETTQKNLITVNQNNEERAAKLHQRINDVSSHLDGKIDNMSKTIIDLLTRGGASL